MTNTSPLAHPCTHLATPQERRRDPGYQACAAAAGQPCRWAARYDGVADPLFHSERLEAAADESLTTPQDAMDPETFRETVLSTGLV